MSVLSFDRVTYTYPDADAPALRDVTLAIEPGELVVLAGGSGAGKSTLLRAAAGLVPHFHGGEFAGRVTVNGRDTRTHGPGELSASVGSMFQDPETQVLMGTVRAELAFPLENQGESGAAIARAVEEIALALRIAQLLDRSTGELSGGELQRVALGAALAGRPALVVLDEPTSQLDPVAGDELIGLLRRLNEDHDTAFLLCEHRLERCLPAADRVIALDRGRVICDAEPAVFLAWAGGHAPALQTPGAQLLSLVGEAPVAGVKRARAALRDAGRLPGSAAVGDAGRLPASGPLGDAAHRDEGGAGASAGVRGALRRGARRHHADDPAPALSLRHVWHELRSGPVILRDVTLAVAPGERVALMGRNGAGKSTLLRHAAGLERPTRGDVRAAGRVALLLQNPGDYLVHERVGDEAAPEAMRRVGLDPDELGERHPRELSGGERQRLALAIVLGDELDAAVICLDEPTRGMDRTRIHALGELLRGLPAAVVVATHDPEFAAAFADRVVLLADGAPIADGLTREVLTGGSYFATETARILGGAHGALTPAQGAAALTTAASQSARIPVPR
jgi:energy-coupling factor transporter ATP-binding protein EcfA2